MAQKRLLCDIQINSYIMAKLNRDYGKGKEFLIWTLLFSLALVALMVWVYKINFVLTF
jgi:hypothetical protein